MELLLVLMRPEAPVRRKPGAAVAFLDAAYSSQELGGEVLPRHLRRVALSEDPRA